MDEKKALEFLQNKGSFLATLPTEDLYFEYGVTKSLPPLFVFSVSDKDFFPESLKQLMVKSSFHIHLKDKEIYFDHEDLFSFRALEICRKFPLMTGLGGNSRYNHFERIMTLLEKESTIFNADYEIFLKNWKHRIGSKPLGKIKKSELLDCMPPRVEDVLYGLSENWFRILKKKRVQSKEEVELQDFARCLSSLFWHKEKTRLSSYSSLYLICSLVTGMVNAGAGFFDRAVMISKIKVDKKSLLPISSPFTYEKVSENLIKIYSGELFDKRATFFSPKANMASTWAANL